MEYIPAVSSSSNPVYKPLDPSRKQIRILVLQPGAGNVELQGSLFVADLTPDSAKPHYDAVSYCWGDARPTNYIILDQRGVGVPESATEVLHGLRHESEPRRLWIDAICINQEDIKEREQQVSIMAQVYRMSLRTRIWLGLPDDDTQRALECLREILKLTPKPLFQPRALNFKEWQMIERKGRQVDPDALPYIATLGSIYSRPWFSRLWVYQEAALSLNAVCHIGSESFKWKTVETATGFLLYMAHQPAINSKIRHFHHLLTLAISTRWQRYNMGQRTPLFRILNRTRSLLTTDPRDKVYGVLALTSWSQQGLSLPHGLQPNYSLSVMQCFRQTTRCIIEEDGNLNYISSLGRFDPPEDGERWPSWVCHMSASPDKSTLRTFPELGRADDRARLMLFQRDNASDDSLFVGGYLDRAITSVEPVFSPRIEEILNQIAEVVDQDESNNWPLATWFILAMAGRFRTAPLVEGNKDFTLACSIFERLIRTDSGDGGRVLQENLRPEHDQETISAVKRDVHNVCNGRRFFWTESSIGIGPGGLQRGDIIAILLGCSFPVILRRVDSHYQLIGPCHVYGIMDGQVVRLNREQGKKPKVIEIR